jgi:mono/diheme cytochrome c family protein
MLSLAPGSRADEPRTNYMLNCMGCHVQDGSGALGKVPSLRDTLVPFARTAAGRRYLVQVPGTAQSVLSDAEIAQLLNWMMRQLSSLPLPAGVADFTAQEVSAYRSQRLQDPAAVREQLLATIPH